MAKIKNENLVLNSTTYGDLLALVAKGKNTATKLSEITKVKLSVSLRHLKAMEEEEILKSRKSGRVVIFEINYKGLGNIFEKEILIKRYKAENELSFLGENRTEEYSRWLKAYFESLVYSRKQTITELLLTFTKELKEIHNSAILFANGGGLWYTGLVRALNLISGKDLTNDYITQMTLPSVNGELTDEHKMQIKEAQKSMAEDYKKMIKTMTGQEAIKENETVDDAIKRLLGEEKILRYDIDTVSPIFFLNNSFLSFVSIISEEPNNTEKFFRKACETVLEFPKEFLVDKKEEIKSPAKEKRKGPALEEYFMTYEQSIRSAQSMGPAMRRLREKGILKDEILQRYLKQK